MPQLLVFEVGGTQIKYGIVSSNGEVIAAHSQNTCASDGVRGKLNWLAPWWFNISPAALLSVVLGSLSQGAALFCVLLKPCLRIQGSR
ncbi:MAG: hypothetical protein RL571_2395 [Pseudomonadota bacterium]|jgi:sugar (pentulose or hexulose) kinase